jgi:hypothetical protein
MTDGYGAMVCGVWCVVAVAVAGGLDGWTGWGWGGGGWRVDAWTVDGRTGVGGVFGELSVRSTGIEVTLVCYKQHLCPLSMKHEVRGPKSQVVRVRVNKGVLF